MAITLEHPNLPSGFSPMDRNEIQIWHERVAICTAEGVPEDEAQKIAFTQIETERTKK